MKQLLKHFKIKPTHFIDGWAAFDGVSSDDIRNACKDSGARIHDGSHNSIVSMNIMDNFHDITCFGKVNNNGDILIQGISGLILNNDCESYLKNISNKATKHKITDGSVFMEW